MTRWVALLYSVVLTPARRVTAADLMQLAGRLAFCGAKTVLSTGNLIFDDAGDEGSLTLRIEADILRHWGKPIPVLLRSAQDWRALVAANPFPRESRHTPAQVGVRVMRIEPDGPRISEIARKTSMEDRLAASPRAVWVASSGPLSLSPLLRAVGSAKLGVGTFRNASAIAKISAALAPALD